MSSSYVFACSRNSQPRPSSARFLPQPDGSLAFESSYDPGLVAEFKQAVPATARRWDGARKRWLLDPAYAAHVADLCERYLGVRPVVPAMGTAAAQPATEARLVTLEYLGRTKDRGLDGESTASGWADGGWTLVFPEEALRAWFEPAGESVPAAQAPKAPPTLYGVLGVKPDAGDDAIKAAYRRLAKVWHPDVNRDPDAPEQFKAITAAYEVLRDSLRRRRYDAGLAFEASARAAVPDYPPDGGALGQRYGLGYRAPLTCGHVLAEGTGQELVTYWPTGAKRFEASWV